LLVAFDDRHEVVDARHGAVVKGPDEVVAARKAPEKGGLAEARELGQPMQRRLDAVLGEEHLRGVEEALAALRDLPPFGTRPRHGQPPESVPAPAPESPSMISASSRSVHAWPLGVVHDTARERSMRAGVVPVCVVSTTTSIAGSRPKLRRTQLGFWMSSTCQ